LAQAVDAPELSMRQDVVEQRTENDLSLATPHATPGHSVELPLFGGAISEDDEPLITKLSPPRPPLSVRRSTPDLPRRRAIHPTTDTLAFDGEAPASDPAAVFSVRESDVDRNDAAPAVAPIDAPIGARLAAVVIDLAILAAVDAAVIYFTMQICGVRLSELALLPRIPLGVFLLGQNAWYLVAFTAGGQTLGKMAMGIKVVCASPRGSLDVGRAVLREIVWLVLAVPAGLGFLTVLGSDRRGLHDRFAGTRVVR
jgi:uncharacterized RDD family membrane protein YckC